MEKIPLYFNYIENTFPKLLQEAVDSVTHERIEVHIVRHDKPKPFTHCLNSIQKECLERGDKCWMFMHCDAEILDNSIFDLRIHRYENPNEDEQIASVTACGITDLLVLFDTQTITEVNGWDDTRFDNSYMELDLRRRIIKNGFSQPILYKEECPVHMSHKEFSSLRSSEKKGNLIKVYTYSDISTEAVDYDEGASTIEIESAVYSVGDSFVLDGRKSTVIELCQSCPGQSRC